MKYQILKSHFSHQTQNCVTLKRLIEAASCLSGTTLRTHVAGNQSSQSKQGGVETCQSFWIWQRESDGTTRRKSVITILHLYLQPGRGLFILQRYRSIRRCITGLQSSFSPQHSTMNSLVLCLNFQTIYINIKFLRMLPAHPALTITWRQSGVTNICKRYKI